MKYKIEPGDTCVSIAEEVYDHGRFWSVVWYHAIRNRGRKKNIVLPDNPDVEEVIAHIKDIGSKELRKMAYDVIIDDD